MATTTLNKNATVSVTGLDGAYIYSINTGVKENDNILEITLNKTLKLSVGQTITLEMTSEGAITNTEGSLSLATTAPVVYTQK